MDLSLILAACLVSLVGLPHGALDPVIAKRVGLVRRPIHMVMFLCGYLLLVASVIGVWILVPQWALSGFLLASALHFGRDWQQVIGYGGWPYGAAALSLPLLFHADGVDQIFSFLVFGQSTQIPITVLAVAGMSSVMLLAIERGKLAVGRWMELGLLVLTAWLFEPLWYFVFYFCALHSPRHLFSEFRKIPEFERLIVFIVMLSITMLTLSIAAFVGSHLETHYDDISILMYQIIFIGLAALTVPHIALLEWIGASHRSD